MVFECNIDISLVQSSVGAHDFNGCVSIHSCGGNLLLNAGPTRDGRITPIFEERLKQIGESV